MTVYYDALNRAKTYDITGDIDPADRPLHRDLEKRADVPYPAAALKGTAEVQTATAGDRTGGTFDLAFQVDIGASSYNFSVTGLAFNAAATAVQTAVDAAAVAVVPNYVAGDIAVTGGPFGAAGADTVFTFSGESVLGPQPAIVGTFTSLTGGTTDPAISETTPGTEARFWFGVLKAAGCITGTDPAFQAAPAGQYTVVARDQLENYLENETIRRLLREATVQEGQDWESELLPLFNLS